MLINSFLLHAASGRYDQAGFTRSLWVFVVNGRESCRVAQPIMVIAHFSLYTRLYTVVCPSNSTLCETAKWRFESSWWVAVVHRVQNFFWNSDHGIKVCILVTVMADG